MRETSLLTLAANDLQKSDRKSLIHILKARDNLLMQAEKSVIAHRLYGPFITRFAQKKSQLGAFKLGLWEKPQNQNANQQLPLHESPALPLRPAPPRFWVYKKGEFVESRLVPTTAKRVHVTLNEKLSPYSESEARLSKITAKLAALVIKTAQKALKNSPFATLIPFLPALEIRCDDPFFTALNRLWACAEGLRHEKSLLLEAKDPFLLHALAAILHHLNSKIRLYVPLSVDMESLCFYPTALHEEQADFEALLFLKAKEIHASIAETWLLGRPQDRNYMVDIHALSYEFSKTAFFPTVLREQKPLAIPNTHHFPEEVMRLFSPRLAPEATQFWGGDFVDKLIYNAPPLSQALFRYMEKLLRALCSKQLPAAFLALDYLHRAMLRDKPHRLICLPSRDWLARAACLIAKAENISSFDVQTVFVGPRSRYKPSMATYQLAIESYSKQLFIDYFKFEPTRVIVAGGVRYSLIQHAIKAADREKIRRTLPFSQVIFFAASPHVAQCAPIVQALVESLGTRPKSGLVLRLHPSTSCADKAAFTALLTPLQEQGVILNAQLAESLAASDLVVTRYSNVGLEAALANIPVIACDFSCERPPIPLDEMGVALSAKTREALDLIIDDFAHAGEMAQFLAQKRAEYLQNNPLLLSKKPAFQLAQLIRGLT